MASRQDFDAMARIDGLYSWSLEDTSVFFKGIYGDGTTVYVYGLTKIMAGYELSIVFDYGYAADEIIRAVLEDIKSKGVVTGEDVYCHVDNRIDLTNPYESNGFVECGFTEPRLWFAGYKRTSASMRSPVELACEALAHEGDDPLEAQEALEQALKTDGGRNGYFSIYDCGWTVMKTPRVNQRSIENVL